MIAGDSAPPTFRFVLGLYNRTKVRGGGTAPDLPLAERGMIGRFDAKVRIMIYAQQKTGNLARIVPVTRLDVWGRIDFRS